MIDKRTISLIEKLDTNIKSWYMSEYEHDEVGKTLSSTVTFLDVNNLLNSGKGDQIYDLLGGDADTIVRERIFQKMAELEEVNYDDIYCRWLNQPKQNDLEIIM